MSYAQYIEENIFKLAGMSNSYYGDNSRLISNRASSYTATTGDYKNGDYRSMTIPYAAGALMSTVEDMFKWHEAFYHNKLLSKEMLTKAGTAYQLKDGTKGKFGYGWFVNHMTILGSPTLAHSGGISSFNSLEMFLPDEDVWVVVLANCDDVNVADLTSDLATMAIGKVLTQPVNVDSDAIAKYTGKYEMTAKKSRVAMISEKNGAFTMEVLKEWSAELIARTPTTFEVKNVKPVATVEFITDNAGRVTGFVVIQGGRYEWRKIN
jgi:CubicO group peptidase (beta-lactamase class C family)